MIGSKPLFTWGRHRRKINAIRPIIIITIIIIIIGSEFRASYLRIQGHEAPKTGLQDGGDQTWTFTQKMTILVYFMILQIIFLAWMQRNINFACFANKVINPRPQQ